MGKHKDNERKKKEAARKKTADEQIDKLVSGGFRRGQLTVDSVICGPSRPNHRSQMMGGHIRQVQKEPQDLAADPEIGVSNMGPYNGDLFMREMDGQGEFPESCRFHEIYRQSTGEILNTQQFEEDARALLNHHRRKEQGLRPQPLRLSGMDAERRPGAPIYSREDEQRMRIKAHELIVETGGFLKDPQ